MAQVGEQGAPMAMVEDGEERIDAGVAHLSTKEWSGAVTLNDHIALRDEDEYNHTVEVQPHDVTTSRGSIERAEWGSSFDYLVVLLGYAIGIGNVWRFPYLVGSNGGGAFLIPYLICLTTVAAPIFILELCLGQETRCSTVECYKRVHPMWLGVAVGSTLMVFLVCTYYNLLLAYCVLYLFASFTSPLPWSAEAYEKAGIEIANGSTASEEYWNTVVLNRFSREELADTTTAGAMQWHLVGALFLVWAIIFVVLARGIKGSAKAAYITVPLPFLLLVVMFFRAVTLPGAGKGLEYYTRFDTDKCFDPEVWALACGQILFSLSPGMGTAITMSSYTAPGEDVYKTGVKIAFANSSFSIFAGFVVFALLGNMSETTGRSVETLAESSGAGLAFVALAEGLSKFESGANFFSVLFFSMLLMLGFDSTFAWVETLNAVIEDYCAKKLHTDTEARLLPFLPPGWRPSKRGIALGTAATLFLLTLPYCTRVGYYLLDVVDHFVPTYILLLTCFLECVMIGVHYGYGRVVRHVASVTGRTMSAYWVWCWKVVAPVLCLSLLVSIFIADIVTPYEDYPRGLLATGVILMLLPACIMFAIPMKRMITSYRKGDGCTAA